MNMLMDKILCVKVFSLSKWNIYQPIFLLMNTQASLNSTTKVKIKEQRDYTSNFHLHLSPAISVQEFTEVIPMQHGLSFHHGFFVLSQLNTSPDGNLNETGTVLSSLSHFRNKSLRISSLECFKTLGGFYLSDSILQKV